MVKVREKTKKMKGKEREKEKTKKKRTDGSQKMETAKKQRTKQKEKQSFKVLSDFFRNIEQRNIEDVSILYRSNRKEIDRKYRVKTNKSSEVFETTIGIQMLLPSRIGITLLEKLFR